MIFWGLSVNNGYFGVGVMSFEEVIEALPFSAKTEDENIFVLKIIKECCFHDYIIADAILKKQRKIAII